MDNQKVFIIIGLFLTGFLFWQDWLASQNTANNQTDSQAILSTQEADINDVPTTLALANDNQDDVPNAPLAVNNNVQANQGNVIEVQTDLLSLKIGQKGGTINELLLNQYPVSLEKDAPKVQLFNGRAGQVFLAQSGLISKAGLPTHHSQYQAKQTYYQLARQTSLDIPLYWYSDDGLEVIKTYHFTQGSYLIKVSYDIINNTKQTIDYASYFQLLRETLDEGNAFLPTYSGGAIYNEQGIYEKIDFGDFQTQSAITTKGGWLAMVQHYFLAAWIPNQTTNQRYSTKVLDNGANLLSVVSAGGQLAPGQKISITPAQLYVGPKLQKNIAPIKGLDKTVDYGILYIIAKPLEVGLHWIYDFVSSWGWSIILLTVLIKLVFYKLSETSYRSMAKMRKLGPKMKKLKELYGDDKQKVSQKMMAMYKEEKVNPASGCLPIFVQIPVFIALYWVLLESVELRQVSFWWLDDLSAKDPYFILPVLMGASMFIQQKLNPTPPDPMQAKIMMSLPFVFTIFFFWMPSGLVLYWVINNILSIAQQWVINKRIEAV